jgi:hypothetical protein
VSHVVSVSVWRQRVVLTGSVAGVGEGRPELEASVRRSRIDEEVGGLGRADSHGLLASGLRGTCKLDGAWLWPAPGSGRSNACPPPLLGPSEVQDEYGPSPLVVHSFCIPNQVI